jgi:hypothetical protein
MRTFIPHINPKMGKKWHKRKYATGRFGSFPAFRQWLLSAKSKGKEFTWTIQGQKEGKGLYI